MPERDDNDPTPTTRPIHHERRGSVEAAVWERYIDEDGHVDHQVALSALRRGPGGEVRRSATFAEGELAQAIECAQRAQEWCIKRQRVFDSIAGANRPGQGGGASGARALPPSGRGGGPLEVHAPRHDEADPQGLKLHGTLPQFQNGGGGINSTVERQRTREGRER
jgi:hypothetical protein